MTLQIEAPEVIYPDSDGQPMADNTRQFKYIVTIEGGLEALFRHDPNVFVAGDLLWYPVQGDNVTRQAPDALVAFGRPKGERGSYKQWEEGGIAPQVVFEVLSPGNTRREMAGKRAWYARYGVEEYYEYDPDRGTLAGWVREDSELAQIGSMAGWKSPRLGVQFGLEGLDLVLIGPDGVRFESFVAQVERREQAQAAAAAANSGAEYERQQRSQAEAKAQQEQARAEKAEEKAQQEQARAEQAEAKAQQDQARAEQAEERAQRLAARLRELGLDDE